MIFNRKKYLKIWKSITWFILFHKSVINILYSFIPHEKITGDDRKLSWIDNSVQLLMQENNEAYECFK